MIDYDLDWVTIYKRIKKNRDHRKLRSGPLLENHDMKIADLYERLHAIESGAN